jgi:putative tricarboxylic transport membrane protein
MKFADRIVGMVCAGFGILCFFEAYRIWNGWAGTGTMTIIVGVIMGVISLIYFIFPSSDTKPVQWPRKKEWISIGAIGGSFLLYILFMELLGYVVSTWIFMAVTARYTSPTRTSVILLWTGAVAIGTYIVFKRYMMLYLPEGFLGI